VDIVDRLARREALGESRTVASTMLRARLAEIAINTSHLVSCVGNTL